VLSAAGARHVAGLDLCSFEGAGVEGWPAYLENMPTAPDRLLCFYLRPGPPEDKASGWSFPQLQILARDVPGPSRPSQDVLAAIKAALHGTRNIVWADGTADEVFVSECMTLESGLVPLGPDKAGRPQWSITFQLELINI
jgi:hypothetical protein